MLANWNEALEKLHPALSHPDVPGPLVPYGSAFKPGERVEVPEFDVPAGLTDWMRSPRAWAEREGKTAKAKRRNITVTIPSGVV
jgi:uracil-DNA glycosylase